VDLFQFTSWCRIWPVALFAVRRTEIEGFAGDLEAMGQGSRHGHSAAVRHRLVPKYAGEEEPLDRSPAAHVRGPQVDYESHAVALDRNELSAMLVAARSSVR
jgi:integrase/recombinase XerD